MCLTRWQMCLRVSYCVSRCVCNSVDDTIAWLASGSSRAMQTWLVVLLIPLCQCHKKCHQSSETKDQTTTLSYWSLSGSPDIMGGFLYTAQMMSVSKTNPRYLLFMIITILPLLFYFFFDQHESV